MFVLYKIDIYVNVVNERDALLCSVEIWSRSAPSAAIRAPPRRGRGLQWRVLLGLHQPGQHHGALQNR